MTNVLLVVSGSDVWTLKDGTKHPTGFWAAEFVHPHEVFTNAGFTVTVATPGGVRPTVDEVSLAVEFNGGDQSAVDAQRAYLAGLTETLAHPVRLEDVNPDDYDAVYVSGGHGPMEDLADNPVIGRILVALDQDQDRVVAAVCHGVGALLPARADDGTWAFAGKRMTGFTDDEETQFGFGSTAPWLLESRLRDAGAEFDGGAAFAAHVVVDGHLITGQNPASAQQSAEAVVTYLSRPAASTPESVVTYKAIAVSPTGELTVVERPLLAPTGNHVRIRVQACGICHTDAASVHAHSGDGPGVVPGHEVVGIIDALGEGATQWSIGDRVGVAYLGGYCGHCTSCRRGDFVHCSDQPKTGIDVDGGYAEYLTARENALVAIPDGLSSVAAAPLLCAGLTTYNALKNANVGAGSTVGIQGVGGLGHLGIQYADKMGMTTVAIARGSEKEELSRQLGADHYLDSSDVDTAVKELNELGGADLIVATASSGAAASSLVKALRTDGHLVVVGASPDPITVGTGDLIGRGIRVSGSLTGSPIDNEENLAFAARQGIAAMTEEYPLDDAAVAYARMLNGDARFRIVLVP